MMGFHGLPLNRPNFVLPFKSFTPRRRRWRLCLESCSDVVKKRKGTKKTKRRMNSSLMLRRFFCTNAAAPATTTTARASSTSSKKKPLVFLGSPQVSTTVLDALFNASEAPDSIFEVAAIVTQPPARRARGKKLMPSPIAQHALDRGFASDLIFTPERAGEATFLSSLRALQPELCITAAYGNILPTKFLDIPPMGTVNIHPSLLPLYRGAAPVQRALQDGVKETGVSLAFTVRALDAGPIIAYERMEVNDQIKAPDLLAVLFSKARVKAEPQDDSKATLAPKITSDESLLSFDQDAVVLHNKVRAFAGWPGTRAKVVFIDDKDGHQNIVELKIVTTRVCDCGIRQGTGLDEINFVNGALVIPCANFEALEVLELQLPGKNVVSAAAFWNGLRGQRLRIL